MRGKRTFPSIIILIRYKNVNQRGCKKLNRFLAIYGHDVEKILIFYQFHLSVWGNPNVGAAIGRPCGRVYGFASGFGEYENVTARTSDARPCNMEGG